MGSWFRVHSGPQMLLVSQLQKKIVSYSVKRWVGPGMAPGQASAAAQHRNSAHPTHAEICIINWETRFLSLSPQRRMAVTLPSARPSSHNAETASGIFRNPLLNSTSGPIQVWIRFRKLRNGSMQTVSQRFGIPRREHNPYRECLKAMRDSVRVDTI